MIITPSPEQQAVVDQPLHSFRVSAGAGTGKTTTVAVRVAALVARHGLEPEQILGITFTNKAAGELAERIAGSLVAPGTGDDPGRAVEVHTYHGFAAQILREYGAMVGIERSTPLVTPTFSRQILTQVATVAPITTWDLTNVHNVDRVAAFSSELGDNLLTADDIVIPEPPDDVWSKRVDLLAVLRIYAREKTRMGVADYADLITSAWRVVHDHAGVAEAIADRYRAVVLDEYQDTNPAQRELLRIIFAGRVPVMAVGDSSQTIYEWRGASLENFAAFCQHFPNGATPAPSLPLTENRRSGGAILAVANDVRARLEPGSEPLTPLPATPPGTVRTAWLGTAAEEADWIATEIELLHDDGLTWGDCAVLFRKNKDMQIVHEALSRRDIPYEVANLGGLLSVPEVTDLFCWLRVLARAEDTTALARLLLGGRCRLGLADIARLSDWVRGQRDDIDDDIEGLPDYTLVEAFDHLDEIADIRPEAMRALVRFRDEHRRLLEAAQGLSLVELCRTILDVTGAWQDVDAMSAAAGLSARLNLFRFLDLAESWSPLEGRPSLTAFTAYLDLMGENPKEELDTARVSDADAVTLITVHRAKGLEWEAVFLPAAYHGNFPSRYQGGDPYVSADVLPFEYRLDRHSLPPISAEMDREERKTLLRDRHDASEWRLAYVAATRARQHLTVSGAWWYGHPLPLNSPTRPSELFQLVDGHADRVRDCPDAPPRPERTAYRSAGAAPDPAFPEGWASALRHAMADAGWARREAIGRGVGDAYDAEVDAAQQRLFSLPDPPAVDEEDTTVATSATGLVTYAVCPKRYHWTWVDPLPRRASAAARRGVDVHRRIELHNLGVVSMEDLSDSTYDLVGDEGEPGSADPFETFRRSRYAESRPLLTEVPFELRSERGWVRGRIDAVYPADSGWEVVDFKSGRGRPDGPNLVQLQTYAVAVRDVDFGLPPPESLDVSFVYLGGPEPDVRTRRVDNTWMAEAEATVDTLLGGIRDERWEPTPSEACHRCDFLRFCETGRRFVG